MESSFLQQVSDTIKPIDVELENITLADGKPLVIRCRPFMNMDWYTTSYGEWSGLPIFDTEDHRTYTDWSVEEKVSFLRYLRAIASKAITHVSDCKDVDGQMQRVWVKAKVFPDDADITPRVNGETYEFQLKHIDKGQNVQRIGLAVFVDSNEGGLMAEAPEGFRAEDTGKDRRGRKAPRGDAARVHAKP